MHISAFTGIFITFIVVTHCSIVIARLKQSNRDFMVCESNIVFIFMRAPHHNNSEEEKNGGKKSHTISIKRQFFSSNSIDGNQ